VARLDSGDIGVFVGFMVGSTAYALARSLEKMWNKKKSSKTLALVISDSDTSKV